MSGYHHNLVKIFLQSAQDFLESTGARDIVQSTEEHHLQSQVGLIFSANLGFASEMLKGVFVITTHAGLIDATNPQREYIPTFNDSDRVDWIGEMANQIVGNLKRHLALYNVACSLSTPSVTSGRDLVANPGKAPSHLIEFSVAGAVAKMRFAIEFSLPINFDIEVCATDPHAASGDAMLF